MRSLIPLMAFSLGMPLQAQRAPANEMLLDTRQPSVYVEYVRSEAPSGTSGQTAVWLQLHNNTKWAISIRTESLYIGNKVQPLTLRNGKGALAIRPGIIASPCYAVEEVSGE